MLSLPALHALLTQVLSPTLHTAILLTTAGDLVSYSTSIVARSKDDIRVIVGLTGEIWLETTESQRTGRVDSELGKILVLPVDDPKEPQPSPDEHPEPLMLLALNANVSMSWEDMELKGKTLAGHLGHALAKFRQHLSVPKPIPPAITPSLISPAPLR